MMHAVLSPAGARRIQTTPENGQENTGASVQSVPSRRVRGRATYRTWPVFSFALLSLLGLMLIPAVTALRRSEAIYDEIRTDQEQFQRTQRVFEALSQNVLSISLTIREFLLDSSPEAGRTYRGRLAVARDQLKAEIAALGQVLPPGANGVLPQLKQQVDDYLAVVGPVFAWTAQERAARGVYFLREEQRPRRETILAVARQVSELNASVYAEQQRHTTQSEQWFRSELTKSVLFAFLAGLVVSTGGIQRMRSLERKAAAERDRAEQTTEEIRQLSVQLRQAQEEERRTISRELHDDVGQQLTAIRMELGTLERLRADHGHEFDARLAELKGMAEQSLHVIRDIAAGLRPSV
ncbi:MAG: sensor histidine kinase, partial [Vicinamibacterales bacterium]